MLSRIAKFAVRHRRRLPQWVQHALNSVTSRPGSLFSRLSTFAVRGARAEPTTVPDASIRVYIAPTNYAGQGFQWARCLERAEPAVQARNVAVRIPGGFAFPADTSVSMWESTYSRAWANAEWNQALQFSHVLIEAERPVFGARFGGSLRSEVNALRASGVRVAFLSHGTDIRLPSRHLAANPLSPYRDDPRTPHLAAQAVANLALLAELGGPQFVSTPDLLDDLPNATWCPVVVDVARFHTERTPILTARPRIIHISSDPIQKGSDLIVDALAGMVAAGRIELEIIEGVPSAEIPALLASADIVLDQFRLASYGVAACEALAAGRIVIGNVSANVRERVRSTTALELPILQALPEELPNVIESLLADPAAGERRAALGPTFVRAVHSGQLSAEVLLRDWISLDADGRPAQSTE